jgi:hypothetical protein
VGFVEQGFERKGLRSGCGSGAITSLGEMENLALIREQHTGDAHREDHDASDAAHGEMGPKEKFSKCHGVGPNKFL